MKTLFNIFIVAAVLALSGLACAETAYAVETVQGSSSIRVKGDLTVESGYGVAGQSFILDGSKSQDAEAGSFLWQQVGGPTVAISQSSATPTVTPSVPGTYVFELIVTDSTGLSSVAKKFTYIVQNNETNLDFIKSRTDVPAGDPDFDLVQVAPPVSLGDLDKDDIPEKTAPTVFHEDRGTVLIGDPDFDQLNISIGGKDLDDFRAEVSSEGTLKKVTVRGWDPQKKESIISRPQDTKTADDLKIYVEAIALDDDALKDIAIGTESIEMRSRERGKLFGFIPVHIPSHIVIRYSVQDSSADPVDVQFSWWHIFVKKEYNAGALEEELTMALASPGPEVSSSRMNISHVAQTLHTVSSIMKTRHDTVKNSVSNIR